MLSDVHTWSTNLLGILVRNQMWELHCYADDNDNNDNNDDNDNEDNDNDNEDNKINDDDDDNNNDNDNTLLIFIYTWTQVLKERKNKKGTEQIETLQKINELLNKVPTKTTSAQSEATSDSSQVTLLWDVQTTSRDSASSKGDQWQAKSKGDQATHIHLKSHIWQSLTWKDTTSKHKQKLSSEHQTWTFSLSSNKQQSKNPTTPPNEPTQGIQLI